MKKRDILRDGIGKIEDSTLERFDKIEAEVEAKKAASEGKRRFPLIPIIAAAAVLAVIIAPITLKMTGSFGIFGPGERTEGSQSPESTPSEPTAETTPEAVTPETTPEAVTPETTPEAVTPETTPETSAPETTPLYANITYEPSADGESYVIVSYEGNYENLTLPTMHDNKYVTAIAAEAFKGSTLEVVILPEFITEIGDGAFEGSASLRNVVLFQSLERIGNNAFKDCVSLEEIKLYRSLEYIGEMAFANCYELEEVIIERGSELTSVEKYTFKNCDSLKSITIPEGVQYIATGAFYSCGALESVTFGDDSRLTEIMSNAFSNCTALREISLPDSLETVGNNAFKECKSLYRVNVSENCSLNGIGESAFEGCSSLISFTVPGEVTEIMSKAFSKCYLLVEVVNRSALPIEKGMATSSYGGITGYAMDVHNGESRIFDDGDFLFFTYDDGNYLVGYIGNGGSIELPDSFNGQTYEIGNYLFYQNDTVTNVTVSSGVTAIGDYAFRDCTSMTKVLLSDCIALTKIGTGAFLNCSGLTEFTLPEGVSVIPTNAFKGCTGLREFTVPAGVKSIEDSAFSGCYGLHTITFAEGSALESVGEYAFSGCRSLLDIELPIGVKSIGDRAFDYCIRLEYIYLPNTVKAIGSKIILGSAVKRIFFLGTEEEWNGITKDEKWNDYKTDCEVYFGDIRYEKVSVTYVLDGGTGDSRNPEMLFKGGVISSLIDPMRSGYDFIGWTWKGQSTPVRNLTDITVSEDMVITANWQSGSYNELYEISKSTPVIDGERDSEYEQSRVVRLRDNGAEYATGEIYFLWDDEALYFFVQIYDGTLQYESNSLDIEYECLEIMLSLYKFDINADYIEPKRAYDIGDAQFRIYRTKDLSDCETVVDNGLKYNDGSHGGFGKWVYDNTNAKDPASGSNYMVHTNDSNGFVAEGFIKWSPELKEYMEEGVVIGIGLQYNDDINDDGKRDLKCYNENAGDNSMSMSGNRATCGKFILVY